MDFCFELIVPELPTIRGLNDVTPTVTWGGKLHVQSPLRFAWGKHVAILDYCEGIPPHIFALLPSTHANKRWKFLEITGDCLDIWRDELMGKSVADWEGASLEDLLQQLFAAVPMWCLVFERQCDSIDQTYWMNS